MAVTNSNAARNRNVIDMGASAGASGEIEKKKSLIWLNVGLELPGEDGEIEYVTLPLGLAIDTMKEVEISNRSTEKYKKMQRRKNALLQKLQALGSQLELGEESEVTGFTLKMRRVDDSPATFEEDSDGDELAGLDVIQLITSGRG